MLIWLGFAFARPIAIHPFEEGQPSRGHTGLGAGIAEQLRVDLAEVPGMEVTEPEQAEWVVRGTWRVHEREVELVAEVYEGERSLGRVVHTSSTGDYLTAVKNTGLDLARSALGEPSPGVVRRVLASPATEEIRALAAFGRGRLALAEHPRRAVTAFEEALDVDPSFDAALQGLAQARTSLELQRLGRSDDALDARTVRLQRAVERTDAEMLRTEPEPSLGPAGRAMVRFAALAELGRTCQASEEMRRYLLRNQGRFPNRHPTELREALAFSAGQLGVGPHVTALGERADGRHASIVHRAPRPSLGPFIWSDGPALDLVSVSRACVGGAQGARFGAMEQILQALRDVGGPEVVGDETWNVVRVFRVVERAAYEGATDAVLEELDALETAPLPLRERKRLTKELVRARVVARDQTAFLQTLAPFRPDDLPRLARRLADARPGEGCEPWFARSSWERAEDDLQRLFADGGIARNERKMLRGRASLLLAAHTLGCLDDPAIVTDVASARRWVRAVLDGRPLTSARPSSAILVDVRREHGWYDEEEPEHEPEVCLTPASSALAGMGLSTPTCPNERARVEERLALLPDDAKPAAVGRFVRSTLADLVVSGCVDRRSMDP